MNRLKELRKNKKDTQQDIADILSMSRRGYQKLENGESQIKPDKAQALADYFGVSVGYLLGFSDYPDKYVAFEELKKKNSSDFANLAKAKILTLVSERDLDKIEKKYVLYDGYEPNYMPYIDFLHAIDIMSNTSESDLLVWFALLDDKEQKIILELVETMGKSKL